MLGFTTHLSQLGRQSGGSGTARSGRQLFARWLNRPHWEPDVIYSGVCRLARPLLMRGRSCLLLVDTTVLGKRWIVLQVSIPWQRRALPLWRCCYPYAGAGRNQARALAYLLAWLAANLPGRRSRYVLVMDRGFPDAELVRYLQKEGWRFVMRARHNWTMTHAQFSGWMWDAADEGRVCERPRIYRNARLGRRHPNSRQPDARVQANVVHYHGLGHKEPWYLVTTERTASRAVAIYRMRMSIEQEFRDLKGPLGLDHLGTWCTLERVARFLATMAIYEWRLACLWIFESIAESAHLLQVGGPLSWIRATREWVLRNLRSSKDPALAWL